MNFIHGKSKFSSNDLQIEFELYLPDILKNDILIAQLPGETGWKSFKAGTSFEVEANVTFKVKPVGQSSYLCRYK